MYVLFPGRHLVNTTFQEEYLMRILNKPISELSILGNKNKFGHKKLSHIAFAVTSANLDTCRYSPVPRDLRVQSLSRLSAKLSQSFNCKGHIITIPHYPNNPKFAKFIISEVYEQTEGTLKLTPKNTLVLSSTPVVTNMFRQLGFSILPAEAGETKDIPLPQDILDEVVKSNNWMTSKYIRTYMSESTFSVWEDHPWIINRIIRISKDPLLSDTGDLTEERDYNTYVMGMDNDAILSIKYAEIKPHIKEGKIVDEGCSTGSMLIKLAKDFSDSDLIGVEITGEFYKRCEEAIRAGMFGETYVHFHQRNALQKIFEDNSINTVICNSTTHEYYSYAGGVKTLRKYLKLKYAQLVHGGRLLIRDVVAPENNKQIVLMKCKNKSKGVPDPLKKCKNKTELQKLLTSMNTYQRFLRFAKDYRKRITYTEVDGYIKLKLADAYEFMTKYMYIDNWSSEMHEEFGFWSFSDWKKELSEIGFEIIENTTDYKKGSHAYRSEWTRKNHWDTKIELFDAKTRHKLAYPVTNMVMVAQK